MFAFEWVAAAYFLLLAAAAGVAPAPPRRAIRGAAASSAAAVFVLLVSHAPEAARLWSAHLYLVLGYWIPSILTAPATETRFERWLRQTDVGWRSRIPSPPRRAGVLLELAYLACYVVVPAAFLTMWLSATTAQVDRYCVAVLLSGFSCYGSLPWLVSRPPRMFSNPHGSSPGVAAFNVSVLRRVSHELNTFPSGHVAVATAVALMLFPISPPAGAVFGVVAAGIAAGAAIGRYHYGVDVIAGVLVGIAAALIAA
jgi:membrane-associated phospholipid phosphatase